MTDDRIKFDYVLCSSRIRELREAKKESHATLGNAVSINEQTLKNYEQAALYKGQSTGKDRVTKIAGMSINNLCKLADHFGVSTDYLLGRSDIQTADADIQAACKTTGLTEKAIMNAQKCDSQILSYLLESELFSALIVDIENLINDVYLLSWMLDGVPFTIQYQTSREQENGPGKQYDIDDISRFYNLVRVGKYEIIEFFGDVVEEIAPIKSTLLRARETLRSENFLSASDEIKAGQREANNGERS